MCFINIIHNLRVRVPYGQKSVRWLESAFIWTDVQNPWKYFQAGLPNFLLQLYFRGRLLAVNCPILKKEIWRKKCFCEMHGELVHGEIDVW